MIRTIVLGAAGRMGRMLVQAVYNEAETQLSGATELAGSEALGRDAGELAGLETLGVLISDDLKSLVRDADVVIDFTSPEYTMTAADLTAEAGCCLVTGTTGLSAEQQEHLQQLATNGARIVAAPNMSIGINLLFSLCEKVTPILGDAYDIEVVEMHHNRKKDAPSGTAVRLGEILASAAGMNYAKDAVHGRQGNVGARPQKQIGMHAVRGGDVVGDHTVIFAADGERVELTHKASSRETFAKGAVRAAQFIVRQKSGLYDMQDVLGLR